MAEVALSQSRVKLNSDVRFWLQEKDQAVQTVVTIEKCGRDDDEQPMREQTVTKEKHENTLIMRGVPLIIDFEKLFVSPIDYKIGGRRS